ncbi:MAG: hypothetical protein ACT4PJ_12105 [Gemmatimonadaceae bacterium]
MATAAPVAMTPRTSAKYDRVFYSSMAIAMALTVLLGFGPTYYVKAFTQAPMSTLSGGPMTLLVQTHGVLFTAWVVLFIVQTALVAQHKVAIHRRVGIAGAVLAASMVVVGTITALTMAARGAAPAGIDPLSFAMIPLSDMFFFAVFVAAALRMRANREAHKRLMLLAYVSIIVAAVARLPGVLPLGPLAFFAFAFVFILIGIIYDGVSRHRVHPVYVWGGGVLFLSVPLRLVLSRTDAWKSFAQSLIALVS